MYITSVFPAIFALLFAVTSALMLMRRYGAPPTLGRFSSIDGLRGYLAYFVFLHHSCIWYFYMHTGQWKLPPSNLYTNFGQGSVALFFMITGFLFFSKLIDGRTKGIDWERLYISRFLRLAPLYFFAIFMLFFIVALLSGGILAVPIISLIKGIIRWLSFAILDMPDLNGVSDTFTIIAGVTWSLAYECFFYLSLPILAITVKLRPPVLYILVGFASFVAQIMWHTNYFILMSFLGGIIASFIVRLDWPRKFAVTRLSSFIVLLCISSSFALFPSAYKFYPLLFLTLAFSLIACGNSLFGILESPVSRTLGEMAYSIYLLHGLILFVTFNFILGIPESKSLSPFTYWLIIWGVTPILIFTCFFSFRYIEQPSMNSVNGLTGWLRRRRVIN
jgi:peptidoglycan/LPS O-acetylase OafA/YrhL